MASRVAQQILLCFSLLQLLHCCVGEIKNPSFQADTRPIILFEKFGFALRGRVNISVSGVALAQADAASSSSSRSTADPSLFGFLLATDDSLVQVVLEYERAEVAVSMDVRTEMYNVVGTSDSKNFLPAGQTQLPYLFLTFFFVYVMLLCAWTWLCLKNRASVHMIHILMGVLVFVKALDLITEAEDKFFISATGTPHGWDIAFYVFSFLKGIMLFVVIVLIGTGWTILRPFLQDKDKRILMVVIPLQVFSNIASVVIDETGPFAKDWATWKQLLLVVDIACCCAVLLPIMWSIRDLKKAAQTDGKAARTLVKLTLFRQYYI
eukprot:c15601_g2_i2 orf=1-963(-)